MESPGEQMERVFPRDAAEPGFDVGVFIGRLLEQFLDHRLWAMAFDERQSEQSAIFRAQIRALLEEQLVIGRLRLAGDGERVHGEAAVGESVTVGILGDAAKLRAEVFQEPVNWSSGTA